MNSYSYNQWRGKVRAILKRYPKRKEYLAYLKRQETLDSHPRVAYLKGISSGFYADCLMHSYNGDREWKLQRKG